MDATIEIAKVPGSRAIATSSLIRSDHATDAGSDSAFAS